MRVPDLPGGHGPADQPPARPGPRQDRLAELRQRLERLPPGHPSAPDRRFEDGYRTPGDPAYGSTAVGDIEPDDVEGAAGPGPSRPAEPDQPGGRPAGERDAADRSGRTRGDAGYRARLPSAGDLGLHGRRDPYRPWFAGADWTQPWFTGEY